MISHLPRPDPGALLANDWCVFLRGSRKFCQWGPNFDKVFFFFFFFLGGGGGGGGGGWGSNDHQKRAIVDLPAKRHRWQVDNGPPLNADLAAL